MLINFRDNNLLINYLVLMHIMMPFYILIILQLKHIILAFNQLVILPLHKNLQVVSTLQKQYLHKLILITMVQSVAMNFGIGLKLLIHQAMADKHPIQIIKQQLIMATPIHKSPKFFNRVDCHKQALEIIDKYSIVSLILKLALYIVLF